MKVRLSWRTLRPDQQLMSVVVDMVMIMLIIINLIWIVFDWVFTNPVVQDFLRQHASEFFYFYKERIHEHFLFYDLIFVSIFLTEILVHWIISIKHHIYHRWYFYPFVHWYDVLGCIPIGSFRALRLLRVVVLVMKLQKRGIIDLRETAAFQFFSKYLNALEEEISDRVILRMLTSVEEEIKYDTPVTRQIVADIMSPRREIIVRWLSERIGKGAQESYAVHENDIRNYVSRLITEAIDANRDIARIERLPMFGKFITTTLERSISDIVFRVIHGLVSDLAAPERNEIIDELTRRLFESVLEEPETIDEVVRGIALESIGVLKARVRVQRWKDLV